HIEDRFEELGLQKQEFPANIYFGRLKRVPHDVQSVQDCQDWLEEKIRDIFEELGVSGDVFVVVFESKGHPGPKPSLFRVS
ncbi:MAG: hypothetical protein LBL69_02130, partial [Zoogloeaceae bacterium]|nr:hypothetical protein [Zoogloeaceae bacterium]